MSKHDGRHGELRISGSGLAGGTKVELDGQDISCSLSGLAFSIDLDDRPRAVLDVVLKDLSTSVENPKVVVPDATRELLIRLGWTPPEGDGAS
ncbi:hypothetical protein ACODT3_10810 [Streptomyces sp. 4.24]|uniref:hypothetical protein n=1 Tax=Streptomyces tritrimontium TaxID=3406573 RepID=UPI003BB50035